MKASYDNPQPKKMKCFCCGSDQCFSEKINNINTLMCFSCGYMTQDNYQKKNLEFQSQLMNTAQIVRELAKEDPDTKLTWLPAVLTTKKGMIFPEGTPNSWSWTYAPLVLVEADEQDKYLKPDGTPYSERLAVEQKQSFPKGKFIDACKAMDIVTQGRDINVDTTK